MARAVRGAPELEVAPALEHAVEDGLGEIRIVEHSSPRPERLVGGEDHRPPMQVAVVDALEEDVRGIRAVTEVAHLVDDQDVGMGI